MGRRLESNGGDPMKRCGVVLVCFVILSQGASRADDKGATKVVPPVLNFTMKDIAGKEVELSKYRGKVVMFVNVASECGYTPQYAGLQKLHAKYEKQGLVVIGVPANEFGGQEPGSNEAIQKFCKDRFGVTFPMMAKVVVKGNGIAPLYDFLTAAKTNPKFAGPVKWNFEKFLVGKSGDVIGRFGSDVEPDSAELVKAVEAELKR